jgi:hypothetical protein
MTEQTGAVYAFLEKQGFLPVDKTSYPLLKKFDGNNTLQEKSIAIVIAWSSASHCVYKIIRGCLCVAYFYGWLPVYFSVYQPKSLDCPFGQIVDVLYDLSQQAGLPSLQIRYIEEWSLKEYQAITGYNVKTHHLDNDDEYIYPIGDLLDLSGNANYYKRKRIKQFTDAERVVVVQTMTRENVAVCLDIEQEWCRSHDCAFCESFCGCEKKALEIMVDIFDERLHTGFLCCIDNKPVGYIICEKIDSQFAYLYFGKVNVENCFIYLIYTMAKEQLNMVKYMNMNDDMGNTGLRQFKTHLSAYRLLHRQICEFTRTKK